MPVAAVGRAALLRRRYWSEPGRGGHFGVFEQPGLFVDKVRALFRLIR